jgi:hypothetical protein
MILELIGNDVIVLGPGFHAGKDVHLVIETNRGHDLGRIISNGEAEPNTGKSLGPSVAIQKKG